MNSIITVLFSNKILSTTVYYERTVNTTFFSNKGYLNLHPQN
jgi:hypothetical protein